MKATPTKEVFPLNPVRGEQNSASAEKNSTFFVTLCKGYVIAQFIGFALAVVAFPSPTFGATTKGRVSIKNRYLTSETKSLNAYGFERIDEEEANETTIP